MRSSLVLLLAAQEVSNLPLTNVTFLTETLAVDVYSEDCKYRDLWKLWLSQLLRWRRINPALIR